MIIEVKGSGSSVYSVDTKEITCTCRDFTYRRSRQSSSSEERLCKHLAQVYREHPELRPISMMKSDQDMDKAGIGDDGVKRYPRSLFDMFISDIKQSFEQFNSIKEYRICGEYALYKDKVDRLICLIDCEGLRPILTYLQSFMGANVISDDKVILGGFLPLEIIRCDSKDMTVREFYVNSSKDEVLRFLNSIESRGLRIEDYKVYDGDAELIIDTQEKLKELL